MVREAGAWDRTRARIDASIQIGIMAEADNPDAATPNLTDEQRSWLASWLAGEGFVHRDDV